ncbi:DUF4843 domain-containing protein [Plebeiibacterium sediminum]|uniref:DUF4843 domain-containing protein n=1 Tax=Plebeiibacterium sediminum TaxID=2992112 RepID=A0AAE3M3D0_9BACT|nr:DUF4843 domain-containing protein [Plebeiobacterium sediminum]MCW3786427.1 DUF4843 domain-containing protein [Plebeiobacterium sediminum]
MKRLIYISFSLLLILAIGCENDDFVYNGDAGIYVSSLMDQSSSNNADSVVFSFKSVDATEDSYPVNMFVHLQGRPSSHDLSFDFEVVDSLTNVPASAYEITNFTLPAGQFNTAVPVVVQKNIEGFDLTEETARVTFKIKDTPDLEQGLSDFQTFSIVWCDFLVRPESWRFIEYYIGPFSQARYKFIIENTGYETFEDYSGNYNMQFWLQGTLIRLLDEYNSNPANEGRPEGWPYLDDDGEPLRFGAGI